MKHLYKQKREQGFTIIEVLIVLAVAALILLIVFLAVPALQRNARNTSVKTAAADLLASVNEYVANNNGSLPTTGALASGTFTFSGAAGSTTSEVKVPGSLAVSYNNAPASAPSWPAANSTVIVVSTYKCNGNNALTASPRSVAAIYLIENSGSTNGAPQCVDS